MDTHLLYTSYTLHAAHLDAFGHRLDLPVELVGLRVEGRGRPRVDAVPAEAGGASEREVDERTPPVVPRPALADRELRGPAIVIDRDATTWVAEGWTARLDAAGHLLLVR